MKRKKKFGDRPDGYRVRNTDPMHVFLPFIMPNRADNEAVIAETVDLTEINKYLEKKNANSPEFKYTIFHVICASLAKTIELRPKLNYFYAGKRLYERNEISFSFVVKKQFTDKAEEALAIVRIDDESDKSPIDQIYEKIKSFVYGVRKEEKQDGATGFMSIVGKLPRFLVSFVWWFLRVMEFFSLIPKSVLKIDPYHTTAFISNLGSIKLKASYHHLTNWGSGSLFVVIDEKKKTPIFAEDGTYQMKETVNLSLTIDERIADGMYYSNSMKILRKLLANPELLDLPINTPV